MRRLAALALVAAVGCGTASGDDAGSVLTETAKNLETVRSGTLDMDVTARAGSGKGFGFTVTGPFGFEEDKPLPILDVKYVRTAGNASASTRVVSTGTQAYVVVGEKAYRLPESSLPRTGGLSGVRVDRWLVDPVLEEGGETDTIRAKLDVVNALNDISALAGPLGSSLKPIEGGDAERLRTAGRDSTVVVTTGHDDRLLRTVELTVTLDAASRDALPEPLRELAPVTLTMSLELTDPDQPVSVTPPATSEPFDRLRGS